MSTDSLCELRKRGMSDLRAKEMDDEAYAKMNQAMMDCGEDCDCCLMSQYGGIGYGSDE